MRALLRGACTCATGMALLVGLVGCGGDASTRGASDLPSNALVGEWSDTAGTTVRFTDDVFYTNAGDESRPHFRYEIVSDTRLRMTPVVVEDGYEADDTQNARVENYQLQEDSLTLKSWGRYYRAGSEALKAAQTSSTVESGKQANNADARMELKACGVIRKSYVRAFGVWFDEAYPDRTGFGYSVPQYIKLKRVEMEWGFEKLKGEVGPRYANAVSDYLENEMTDDESADYRFEGWIEAGACPVGGAYTTSWNLDRNAVPQIACSRHGGE